MSNRPRFYDALLQDHLARHRQMALVSGPRQVGKTTACRAVADAYLNWDNVDERRLLLKGPAAIATAVGLDRLRARPPVAVIDELHKHSKWKGLLKGLFDTYGDRAKWIVTGSSRLDVFRRGGDSLMGRYLLFRVHPWSVAECLRPEITEKAIRPPREIDEDDWSALVVHGGFPEPFLKRDPRFTNRWRSLRHEQLSKEDLRDVTRVQELGAIEVLMRVLEERSGQQLVYSNLATEIGVAVDTIRRWVDLLGRLHLGFLVRPWFRNVTKSLRKEPKWFLRDWSGVADEGARAETLVACHLLKATEGWTDLGLGHYELRYLRDKLKREVDFVVVRDGKPWFLVEVKKADANLSPALAHFQAQTGAEHAFQVVLDLPYEEANCFAHRKPIVVPAKTFLSQLL
jgi:predicted AAA+ superfamily ATPase